MSQFGRVPSPMSAPSSRLFFILAAVGAGLASLYWALLTLFIGFGVASGGASTLQIILPIVLIVLYALRAMQLLKGDVNAARRLIWLHGIGCIAALIQIFSGTAVGLLVGLQAFKIAIHIFGGIAAFMAQRSADPARLAT